jgi:hypothetical protein
LHQTISRTRAAAALPSVIGGPGGDFFRRSALGASSLLGGRLRSSILPRRTSAGCELLGAVIVVRRSRSIVPRSIGPVEMRNPSSGTRTASGVPSGRLPAVERSALNQALSKSLAFRDAGKDGRGSGMGRGTGPAAESRRPPSVTRPGQPRCPSVGAHSSGRPARRRPAK